HFRPANALPIVCSFLFGPAAAWGAAFGNLIGDFFTGLGPGDIFGFIGNFLYALVPYRLWRACAAGDPLPRTLGAWALLLGVIAFVVGNLASGGWLDPSTLSALPRNARFVVLVLPPLVTGVAGLLML